VLWIQDLGALLEGHPHLLHRPAALALGELDASERHNAHCGSFGVSATGAAANEHRRHSLNGSRELKAR